MITESTADRSSYIYRRDVGNIDVPANNANLTPLNPAWVEHCKEYKCFCALDSDGQPWDPDTRCKKDCKEVTSDSMCTDCVYLGCDCQTGNRVMKSQSKCSRCRDGFVLINNHCYLDSDMPVAANIIIILGVLLFVGLLMTCWAIGGMDPGYDSVIYRMTQQRIKAQ